jgi:hypothetical protein
MSRTNKTKSIKVFGLTLTYVPVGSFTGNTTPNEICLEHMFKGPDRDGAQWVLRIRGLGQGYFTTTHIYRNHLRLWWNSEFIARKLGRMEEQDWGDCYFYNGWLGDHADV